ncbi:hypothetical protein SISNIDRAFT_390651, partial [Sistotremastrum niveocremeum HHB9708]
SSGTDQRMGALPLVDGMPVILTNNLDVHHGAVNGSMGTLVSVRYTLIEGERYATSCVIHVPDFQGPPLPSLLQGQVAVSATT